MTLIKTLIKQPKSSSTESEFTSSITLGGGNLSFEQTGQLQ